LKALLVALLIVTLLGFMNPWQAQAQAGNYVVADFPLGTLWKIPPPAGPPVAIWAGAPLVHPSGVAVDASGNYIVADSGAGPTLWLIPPPAGPPVAICVGAPLTDLQGVAVDEAGNYIVCDAGAATLWIIPPPAGPPTAIYSGAPLARPTSVDVEPPEKLPVSGLVMPVNKLEILTPYLALAGLIAASSAVVVVRKRR